MDNGDDAEALFDILMGAKEAQSKTAVAAQPATTDALSGLQERLWFLNQMDPDSTAYIIPIHLQLCGQLDIPALKKALAYLWMRHDALRTIFPARDGRPYRKLLDKDALRIDEDDFTGAAKDAWKADYQARHSGPMKLDEGPLFRVALYTIAPDDHALLMDLHHINGDGFSVEILLQDLFAAYAAYASGNKPAPKATGASYDSFIEREKSRRAERSRELDACAAELKNAPTLIDFYFDKPLPEKFTGNGDTIVNHYDDAALFRLAAERGRAEGLTPFMVYLATFGAMLHAHSAQDEILIGVPTSVRPDESYARTVGFFVNTCVAKIDLSGDPTLRELLRRTASSVRSMIGRPDVPLDELVNRLHDKRRTDRPQIVQVALSYLDTDDSDAPAPKGLRVEKIDLHRESAMFELTMDLFLSGNKALCRLEYYSDAWERASAEAMMRHFNAVLKAVVDTPDLRLSEINFAYDTDEALRTRSLEGREIEESFLCVPDLVRGQALAAPERTALVCGGALVSRSRLDRLVALRRSQIVALGLKPGDVLALACAPGMEWVAMALAAMSQCVAVLPVEPNAPVERLRTILEDSGARLLWRDETFAPAGADGQLPCNAVNSLEAPQAQPTDDPCLCHPWATAYIIYTSGTTGRPKGVRVSHGAFAAHCRSAALAYGLTTSDRELAFAPSHFDAFWEQVFSPLSAGASVLMRDSELWSPGELCRRLDSYGVTCADIPPQYLRELLFHLREEPTAAPKSLRMVISGGEAMPSVLAREWLDGPLGNLPLVNAYGPTEAVVTSTINRIDRNSRIETANGVVPIGAAMPGRILYILLTNGHEAGAGMAGELCIGGPCLSEGYHNEPERTGKAFVYWIRTPQGGHWCEASEPEAVRLYRTGDRVRLGPDGGIEFLGRIDKQIKLRGFRIEPGEIEAVLTRHPAIAQALVMALDDPTLGRQLVAYCVPRGTKAPTTAQIIEWLSPRLPKHMIPAAIMLADKFPTAANGKIDASALPRPHFTPRTPVAAGRPADDLEQRIAAIWADLLGRKDFGTGDNFFDLGGHSILLVRLHSRLTSELGAKVRLVDLFANPTVVRMAALVRGENTSRAKRGKRTLRGDVAVIGMAGRFPGAADIDAFWKNLVEGKESIQFFTKEELAEAGIPESLRNRPDYVPAHGYLEGVRLFDAEFFGYTPREAALIDPQQRMFLEECWHALENAGRDPDRYKGDIGVYGGCGMSLYLLRNLAPLLDGGHGAEAYAASLSADKDFITTRVSYKLNLRGPSVNVNTACSTSLVAIHMAAESLLNGECDMALAGGCTLHFPEKSGYVYQAGGIASPDGHCRAFADDAAGTVGGSGCGVVVLKRLEEALADRDFIHAVIKGSAINNDGADKIGFTAPGPARQRDAIRAALDVAGLSARDVHYIEAHGTGTPLGDPIEIQALSEAWAHDNPEPQACLIGAVKSSIGHLDTAAGVAGFIKAALSLERGVIPPTLHCSTPSRKIGFEHTPFRIAQKLEPWPDNSRRRAAVSSFGMGGTNAHAVLEEAPDVRTSAPRQSVWCLPLSARSAKSLLSFALKLADRIENDPCIDAPDAWFTLGEGRKRHPIRAVVMASSREEAVANLRALKADDFLKTDRNGKVVSGSGLPQSGRYDNTSDFADALVYAKAWLTGTTDEAGAALPKIPFSRIPLPGYVFDNEECWIEPTKEVQPVQASAESSVAVKRGMDDWFHFPAWERIAEQRRAPNAENAGILVIHDDGENQSRWLQLMKSSGLRHAECRIGPNLEATLATQSRGGPLPGVCWLLTALDADPSGDATTFTDALLADIRAVVKVYGPAKPRLVLFRPQTGPDAAPSPTTAALDAIAAVIPYEYPEIESCVVRTDPGTIDGSALRRLHATTAEASDTSLLYASGHFWRGTHQRMSAPSEAIGAARLKRHGVYLITGGLGGMGLTIAGRLAKDFQARLILVSRHEPDARQRETVDKMRADGAEVHTSALDGANATAFKKLVDEMTARFGRIDGVIHAAGVAGGSLIARTDAAEISRVLKPKVDGVLALVEAFKGREPDFIVLSSSLTATLGGPGQAAYAAANAWMDDFAASRAADRPGLWTSIRWDAWADVGMAAKSSNGNATPITGTKLREMEISPQTYWPWGQHQIGGHAVLPGTGYLELLALAVGSGKPVELDVVALTEPLTGSNAAVRLSILRDGDTLTLASDASGAMQVHARARVAGSIPAAATEDFGTIRSRCKPVDVHVNNTAPADGIAISTGPRWNIAGQYFVSEDGREALAELRLPAEFASDLVEHPLHPALLDVALSYGIILAKDAEGMLPWRYEKVIVNSPLEARVLSHARIRKSDERSLILDVDVCSPEGRTLLRVEGYTLVRASGKPVAAPAPLAANANPFAIKPEEGYGVFLRALASAEPVVEVSTVDWKFAAASGVTPTPAHKAEGAASPRKPRPDLAIAYREPASDASKMMAEIWAEVLGYDRIGADDDLFDLGADSLTALQASGRLRELTGRDLPMDKFFEKATVENLASGMTGTLPSAPSPKNGWEEGEI
jgi:polyketide synthase PksJ